MRFSSSARKALSALLCLAFLSEWAAIRPVAAASDGRKPVLVLKYSAPSIPDDAARARFSAVTSEIERRLHVRISPLTRNAPDTGPELPEIDDGAIREISSAVAEASAKMDHQENREADKLLANLEARLRKYRFGSATLPLLSDVSMKRGLLSIWEGNPDAARPFLARARALRPGFEPDSALYSPQFIQIWNSTVGRVSPEAEVLVETIPPGARFIVDGEEKGATPARAKLPASRPVRIRVEHPGYRPASRTLQWLPGDSDRIEIVLSGDREARLAELLSRPGDDFGEAARIVSEILGAAGAERVAFLMLETGERGERMRVLEASAAFPAPRLLGAIEFPGDSRGAGESAGAASRMLAGAGWPDDPKGAVGAKRPWYYSWWFLTGLGMLAAGTAVALSGGGGDGGGTESSTASSGVNF